MCIYKWHVIVLGITGVFLLFNWRREIWQKAADFVRQGKLLFASYYSLLLRPEVRPPAAKLKRSVTRAKWTFRFGLAILSCPLLSFFFVVRYISPLPFSSDMHLQRPVIYEKHSCWNVSQIVAVDCSGEFSSHGLSNIVRSLLFVFSGTNNKNRYNLTDVTDFFIL